MTPHLGERLCPLVDSQLQHDERDRALAHLAHCAGCREEVAEYRRMKQRLSGLWAPSLPAGLADRLVGLGGPGEQCPRPVETSVGLGFAAGRVGSAVPAGGDRGRRGPAQLRLPLAFPVRRAAFGPPRRRQPAAKAVSPGKKTVSPRNAELAAAVVELAAPRTPVVPLLAGGLARVRRLEVGRASRGQARVRRTLVGSAALMLLTVTGTAVSDQPTASRGTSVRPAAPTTQLPAANRSGTTPVVLTVLFTSRG